MSFVPYLKDKSIFDLLDFVIANFLLPLNMMLIAVFAGWMMTRKMLLGELGLQNAILSGILRFVLRFVAPLMVLAIFYTNLR